MRVKGGHKVRDREKCGGRKEELRERRKRGGVREGEKQKKTKHMGR